MFWVDCDMLLGRDCRTSSWRMGWLTALETILSTVVSDLFSVLSGFSAAKGKRKTIREKSVKKERSVYMENPPLVQMYAHKAEKIPGNKIKKWQQDESVLL